MHSLYSLPQQSLCLLPQYLPLLSLSPFPSFASFVFFCDLLTLTGILDDHQGVGNIYWSLLDSLFGIQLKTMAALPHNPSLLTSPAGRSPAPWTCPVRDWLYTGPVLRRASVGCSSHVCSALKIAFHSPSPHLAALTFFSSLFSSVPWTLSDGVNIPLRAKRSFVTFSQHLDYPLLVTMQDECLGAAEVWLRSLWYRCMLTFIIVPWTCSETLQGLPLRLFLHPLVPSSLLPFLLSGGIYFTHIWGERHNIVFYPLLVLHRDQFILPYSPYSAFISYICDI